MYTEEYKRRGVPMTSAFGGQYPIAFTHPIREYRALTEDVALIDLSHWGVLRLTGADRVAFLNSQVTSHIATLQTGEGSHAALTTVKGKLVAELFVLAREAELLVLVAQGSTTAVVASLSKYIVADDVTVEDISDDHAVLSAEGPQARALVWRLFPDGPLPMDALTFGDAEYPVVPEGTPGHTTEGIPVTVFRNSAAGGRGFQLIVSGEGREQLRTYLIQAGRGLDMELCGRAAWNMRRVETGSPWWGNDVNDNFPKECRLDGVVDYEKGCYLGQETLARMHHRGHPNWLLVGLAPAGAVPPTLDLPAFVNANNDDATPVTSASPDTALADTRALDLSDLAGAELFAPGAGDKDRKAIGRLTSPVFSPELGTFLSLAYVRHERSAPGTRVELFLDGNPVELEVITLPMEKKES